MEITPFQTTIDELIQLVNYNLSQPFAGGETNFSLYEAYQYAIKGGGKRLRPTLTMLCAGACGCAPKAAIGPALAIEILHNFTLLHDDIMDDSPIRHNQPTVCKKWNNDTAILTGDMMMGFAFMAIGHSDSKQTDANILGQLYNTLSLALVEVCKGQALDMNFNAQNNVDIEDYFEMIKLKTSSLFCCSAKLGAIAAGASVDNVRALETFALNLGYAFQIQDDMLDFNAKNVQFGKKVGQDVFEHKKTYPIIKAKQLATGKEDIEFIANYFNKSSISAPTEGDVNRFIEIFDKLDIWTVANKEINKYVELARAQLDFVVSNTYVDYLKMFLNNIIIRTY